ncbi:CDGSH iron-sulfur domain-containing protein 3, mitochondrial-like [Mizuhopecten yessoensis]|uniref:CDGSH iron-sulfur domain-containing protein 3, mitochondrial n=1 Tax=Mizuhopecten yessoensis TaxID=6573 RepID=A0A210R3B8_MIZYE|nr:CDGSH iron-sulfur domain-containing protein 3, mitochondrial-like [Mizuhopecten yessoensis]OWF55489.1 CDGSH iron-sulfur domain-containing protein 3, mitochondrial [Mizuhopecten yessoensis]
MALSMKMLRSGWFLQSQKIFMNCTRTCSSKDKEVQPKIVIHPETDLANQYPNTDIVKGRIADRTPFRMELQAGKKYSWCACGHSHTQPFCDGNHKRKREEFKNLRLKPVRFSVEETKEYWLCRCKQTDNPPFCDGSHKEPNVTGLFRIQPTT